VTARILARLLAERTVDELLALSTMPVLLPKVNFGMHYGTPWNEVPTDYLRWILREIEMNSLKRATGISVEQSRFDDPDFTLTVRTELAKRSAAPGR
jgi:hypothetical protein